MGQVLEKKKQSQENTYLLHEKNKSDDSNNVLPKSQYHHQITKMDFNAMETYSFDVTRQLKTCGISSVKRENRHIFAVSLES